MLLSDRIFLVLYETAVGNSWSRHLLHFSRCYWNPPKAHVASWGWSVCWLAPPPGVQSGITSLCLLRQGQNGNAGVRNRCGCPGGAPATGLTFTSQLDEDIDLLIQDLFQLCCVRLHVVIHLLRHLQQHLFIFEPPDGFLRTESRTFQSSGFSNGWFVFFIALVSL